MLRKFRGLLASRRAARLGLVPELNDHGEVIAWLNGPVLAKLRAALETTLEPTGLGHSRISDSPPGGSYI